MGEEGIRAILYTYPRAWVKGWTNAAVACSHLALIVVSADPALVDLQSLLHQQCSHKH